MSNVPPSSGPAGARLSQGLLALVALVALVAGSAGCAESPSSTGSRDGGGEMPADALPAFLDAASDASFVGNRPAPSTQPTNWPTGAVVAHWTVTRIPEVWPLEVDAGTDADGEVGSGGAGGDGATDGDADMVGPADAGGPTDAPVDLMVDAPLPVAPSGQPPAAPGATQDGQRFALSVTGGGIQITGVQDEFLFVHRPLYGDGAIVAVARATAGCGDRAISAGVMLRTSVGGEASFGMAAASRADGQPVLMARASTGLFSNVLRFDSAPPLPVWLKVERHGDRLRLGYSRDGVRWNEAERTLGDAPLRFEAGLVAATQVASDGASCSVLFEQVELLTTSGRAP